MKKNEKRVGINDFWLLAIIFWASMKNKQLEDENPTSIFSNAPFRFISTQEEELQPRTSSNTI